MKVFSLGPVEMFPYTLEVAKKQIPYFRTPEFSEVMLESERLLKKVMNAEENSKVIFLTASGTAAMEATVFNCFDNSDKLLVINGGIFGKRFVDICKAYKLDYDEIKLSFGEVLSEEHLAAFDNKGYTALLVNIDETSTGQLYDKKMLSDFCKRNDMYFIVDAISSFLADEYDVKKYGIDVTILSSQKGLAIGPGMSFVVLSDRLYSQKVEKITPPSLYFDFKDYVKNQLRGQTPYTPAVRVALELNDMLKHLDEQGVENRLAYVKSVVDDFRSKVVKIDGIHIPDYPLSNALTPMLFDNMNGDEIYNIVKNKYDIVLTPCGGDLKGKMVRVGHIGNHTIEENDLVIDALKKAFEEV